MRSGFGRFAVGFASIAVLALPACTAPQDRPVVPSATAGARGTTTAAGTTSTADVEGAGEMVIEGDEVTWVDSTLDTSEQQHHKVVPVPGAQPRTAPLADDAAFRTPGTGTPQVSPDGLGAAPTPRDEFLALPSTAWFAPKLFFGPDGEIVKVATRYRP